jgi:hypothetical protein
MIGDTARWSDVVTGEIVSVVAGGVERSFLLLVGEGKECGKLCFCPKKGMTINRAQFHSGKLAKAVVLPAFNRSALPNA